MPFPAFPRAALAILFAATSLGTFTLPAFAHHGWNWAEDQLVEMTATIRAVSMDPPHPTLQVEDASGAMWEVELGNPGKTQRSGFTADSAPAGEAVTILGNRSRNAEERRMKAVRVTIGGTTYDMYPERLPEGLAPPQ